jgi:hypothetical protein
VPKPVEVAARKPPAEAPAQGEPWKFPLHDTFGEVESPPVRFGLLRVTGNRSIRRVHATSKCSDWVQTSMSGDSGFRSGSWAKYDVLLAKRLSAGESTYGFADDCENCRYVERTLRRAIFMLLWQRLGRFLRASVRNELLSPRIVDYT